MKPRTYTDDDLKCAVSTSHSWRGVLRHLGLEGTSAAALRSVRRRSEELELDCSHFTGRRRWTDEALAAAVAASDSWEQVTARLGLAGGSSSSGVKGHAIRLGISFDHFHRARATSTPPEMRFDGKHLPRAGGLLAASWLTLCGYEVSWPLEPCRYDVLAVKNDSVLRIQVKTSRYHSQGSWRVALSTGGRRRDTYDPDDIDYFFIVDADLQFYLIPVEVVGGLTTIQLSAYQQFRLAQPLLQPT